MKYIDLHADTILPILQQGPDSSLYENTETHIDLMKLKAGNALAQCFAVWLPNAQFEQIDIETTFNPATQEEDIAYIDLAMDRLNREMEKYSDTIAWAQNADEIRANEAADKISAILTMEDARAVSDSLENIERFHQQGFQMIGLLWNEENCFGYPNSPDAILNQKGLKPFGIEGIQYMEDLGIIVDVSHLNDGGISDVLKHSKRPVVATHSNVRALAKHPRNLTDEHIKGIAESGGVIGVCISPRFLRGYDEDESTIDDMVRHLDYLLDVGGEEVLAIGTDFDGTSGNIELDSPAKMPQLFERLASRGWPEARIEKLAYGNALRIFEQ